MFRLFRRKKRIELKSPFEGKVIALTEVPDAVFSSKLVGDGIAFEPNKGVIYAPADGKVIQVFPSKHAIGLITEEGLELLIHIGIDTVNLKGEGFENYVKAGDSVRAGDKLMSFDTNLIREKAKSILSPFVITNLDAVESMKFFYGNAHKSSTVAVIFLK